MRGWFALLRTAPRRGMVGPVRTGRWGDAMSTVDNRTVARRFVEGVLGRGDFAVLNALAAPECVDHAGASGPAPCPEAIAQFLVPWRAAFADLQITVEDLVAQGDRVAARWTLCGTHRGAFLGRPPTGQRVAVTGMEFYCLAGGKIIARWALLDTPGLLRQLGAPVSLPAELPGAVPPLALA